jgi:hypothetical protein
MHGFGTITKKTPRLLLHNQDSCSPLAGEGLGRGGFAQRANDGFAFSICEMGDCYCTRDRGHPLPNPSPVKGLKSKRCVIRGRASTSTLARSSPSPLAGEGLGRGGFAQRADAGFCISICEMGDRYCTRDRVHPLPNPFPVKGEGLKRRVHDLRNG